MQIKPTLLFVVNVDWFFLSHRLLIAQEALRAGYKVHVATNITNKLNELEQYGFVVHSLLLDRGSTGVGDAWATLWQLWKVFRSVRPDVVHLVTIKPVLLGGLAARLARVPAVVAAVSGLGFVFVARGRKALLIRWAVERLYRVALGGSNLRVIFQNEDDRTRVAQLARLPANKTALIRGSGVDLRRFAAVPIPAGTPLVVFAARLLRDKGLLEFIEAARLLKQSGRRVRFVLVGAIDPANPSSVTQAVVEAWVCEGVVEWWGHQSGMPQVLAASSLVVLPSYREGLPKVLLEAAASGRAVVTTDVPGCRDAIDPGITGLLVPVRDAEALAEAIDILIHSPARCQVMGKAGRALAERAFDVRQVAAAHLRIYSDLIGTE